MPESSNVELSEKILAMNFVLSDKESTIWGSFKSKEFVRQVLRQFLDLHGNFGNVNKNWLKNFVKHLGRNLSTRQNFSWWHVFQVMGISIVFSWEIDVKTGENIWKT